MAMGVGIIGDSLIEAILNWLDNTRWLANVCGIFLIVPVLFRPEKELRVGVDAKEFVWFPLLQLFDVQWSDKSRVNDLLIENTFLGVLINSLSPLSLSRGSVNYELRNHAF